MPMCGGCLVDVCNKTCLEAEPGLLHHPESPESSGMARHNDMSMSG